NEFILATIEEEHWRAVVAIEHQVGVAVVREIGEERASHSALGGGKPRGGCRVRKCAVAIVAEEETCDRLDALRGTGPAFRLSRGQERVQVSVNSDHEVEVPV